MNLIKLTLTTFLMTSLIACGGGSPDKETEIPSLGDEPTTGDGAAEDGTDTVDGETALTSKSGRNVTLLPLSLLETSTDYSGLSESNVFIRESFYPFIQGVMLSIYDAKTLVPEVGTIDDFIILENDKVVDPLESYPVLQKIGAIPTYLHSAIVIDVSGSVRNSIGDAGLEKIVAETKAFIDAAQASTDPVIAEQRFTIWAFAGKVKEMTTSGFTADNAELKSALDDILDPNLVNEIYSQSNINRAIVQAVGRFDAEGDDQKFRDNGENGNANNDLLEEVNTNRIQLSSLILVTTGKDNVAEFDDEQVKTAIESQSQVIFNTPDDNMVPVEEGEETDSGEVTKNFGKPFITVLVGNDDVVELSITENASEIVDLTVKKIGEDVGKIVFSTLVLDLQTDLISLRKKESDRYFLRYASPKRRGTHDRVITTGAVDTKYSLTTTMEIGDFQDVGMPSEVYIEELISSVEIVGEGDQYLQKFINIKDTNTFYPMTRWTSKAYVPSDYVWKLDGITKSAAPASGAVTIEVGEISNTGVSELTLTNTVLGETTRIQITEELQPLMQIFETSTGLPLNDQTIAVGNIVYVDVSEGGDPENPSPAEWVYPIYFVDFNVPLESYQYNISLVTSGGPMVEKDPSDDTAPYDYERIGNGIQIQKASIEGLSQPDTITITVENTNPGIATTATFTIEI